MSILKSVTAVFVTTISLWPNASNAITTKVKSVGTYPTGAIYVMFEHPISECSTSTRLDIPANDPSVKFVLSLAMAAQVSDSNVEIRAGSCSGTYPVWSSTGDSYFYLKK